MLETEDRVDATVNNPKQMKLNKNAQ